MVNLLRYKKAYLLFSGILILASFFSLIAFGLKVEEDLMALFRVPGEEVIFLLLVPVLTFFYPLIVFRRIIAPVKPWQYGALSLVLFLHDLVLVLGVFSLLGRFYGVGVFFHTISGLLLASGYCLGLRLVFFHQIRENLLRRTGLTFEGTLSKAQNQILSSQINAFLSSLFILSAAFFFVGGTKRLLLALILGLAVGSYSSLFLVGTLLTDLVRRWGV